MSAEFTLMMFSDVQSWQPFESPLITYRPDAIFMVGDLTIDRFSFAHKRAALLVPEFWTRLAELLKSRKLWNDLPMWLKQEVLDRTKREGSPDEDEYIYALRKHIKNAVFEKHGDEPARLVGTEIMTIISTIKSPPEPSLPSSSKPPAGIHPYSFSLRKYAEKFYEALKMASDAGAHVFTVEGNHDAAFFQYKRALIELIPLCKDVGGRLVEFRGLRILGIGHYHTLTKQRLTSFIEDINEPVNIVLCHASEEYYEQTLGLKPQLIYAHIVRGTSRMAIRRRAEAVLVYASSLTSFWSDITKDWKLA